MTPAAWPRPRALLLDAMGTLLRLRQPVGVTYAEAAAAHGIRAEPEAIGHAFARLYPQAPPLAFPGLERDALRDAEIGWWGRLIDAVLEETAGVPAPEALHRQLFEAFADPALWQVYDDVAPALARWQAAGLKLAVVSNFDSRLEGLLADLGLAQRLELVVVSSRAGAAKPSPEPFRQALATLSVSAGEAWHVGDSPEDEAGARAAGLRCLIVRRP